MKILPAIAGGLAGAVAVTLIHELVRKIDNEAPRMDLMGMQAVSGIIKSTDNRVPERDTLYTITAAGDILGNALYYGLSVANKKQLWTRSTLMSLSAGLGALILPKYLGLNPQFSNKTARTKVITTSLYLFGGLVSSLVSKMVDKKNSGRGF